MGATSSSISAIAPTAIAARTTPEVTLSGLPASDLSATSEFAFGVGAARLLGGSARNMGALATRTVSKLAATILFVVAIAAANSPHTSVSGFFSLIP